MLRVTCSSRTAKAWNAWKACSSRPEDSQERAKQAGLRAFNAAAPFPKFEDTDEMTSLMPQVSSLSVHAQGCVLSADRLAS